MEDDGAICKDNRNLYLGGLMDRYEEQGQKGYDANGENGFSRGTNFIVKLGCIIYLVMLGCVVIFHVAKDMGVIK